MSLNNIYRFRIKRIIDITFVILTSPLIFIIGILVAIGCLYFMGTPTIFSQNRIGKNNQIFKIYKFRTLPINWNSEINKLNEISKFGAFLRKSSLDEIPSFINILQGKMSLIGPRPLLAEYLKEFDSKQISRHQVLPGLTGLAQINGRNNLDWQSRFEFDLEYVEKYSFMLDLKIFLRTIPLVFLRKNIYTNTYTEMPKFKKF
jgi:lipopolysaccharide/colanic/teichoic acid biosynthesis glycosyltransferase